MKAVIFCGGKGTRIRDVSEILPKPMLPIGGLPVLWHIMKTYAHFGIKDFVLCLGYKGWAIKEFFLNYYAMTSDITIKIGKNSGLLHHSCPAEKDWRVTLVDSGESAQTGARLWKVRRYLQKEKQFCLTYGDSVADINIRDLVKAHIGSKRAGTITGVRPPLGRFGEIKFNKRIVTEFAEKPNIESGCINGGFMVFDNSRIWDYLSGDEHLVFERQPLERMAKDRELGVFIHSGFWQCMDTLREYDLLNGMWEKGEAPWKVW